MLYLPKPINIIIFIFLWNFWFRFYRIGSNVFFFSLYLEGERAMGRSVGPALKAAALLLIFPLFHHERWVCLKIHCWKGELNGGWTEGGVFPGGMSISSCIALLSCFFFFFFFFQKKKKYSEKKQQEHEKQLKVQVLTFLEQNNRL